MKNGKIPHRGKYKVKNIEKYKGDPDNVVYRSSWERAFFLWADKNPNVAKWSSEEIIIPYIYALDRSPHRYFVDGYLEFKNGDIKIIEIKPAKERKPPKKSAKNKRYLTEAATYIKNQNKWEAAKKYADLKGWKFEVWDENYLKKAKILKW